MAVAGLDAVLHAVADGTRRAIVQRLAHGPATTGQLAELAPMSRPAISQHIKVLQEAGLLRTTVAGRHRWHSLDHAALAVVEDWARRTGKIARAAPALHLPEAPDKEKP
ncbi:metalloregulator ArsR/SmtB family transcription factor [Catellatospora sp. NPDC049111]|uniref:ArsR/SmtB family transcription factor n=1 Tax=Catellatospora sp. NPDC049111 TaxID=3155271 RepID=UPI0033D29D12